MSKEAKLKEKAERSMLFLNDEIGLEPVAIRAYIEYLEKRVSEMKDALDVAAAKAAMKEAEAAGYLSRDELAKELGLDGEAP